MRHSDRRLTDQVYLDTSLLPLQETMRSIDMNTKWTQIWTQIPGETCRLGSRVGETGEEGEIAGSPLTVGLGPSLSQPDGKLRWRDRRDSNPKSSDAKSELEKEITAVSKEQWTQIWTQISDEECQMLNQIIQR